MNRLSTLLLLFVLIAALNHPGAAQTTSATVSSPSRPPTPRPATTQSSAAVQVDWSQTIATSNTTPTLQVVVNSQLLRGSRMHDASFSALKSLGAEYVRYVPWYPYPHQAVAELRAPTTRETSWEFSKIDPMLDDFLAATAGHSVVLNFSTIPAWMWKQEWPTTVPDDPSQTVWRYVDGTELCDPTMQQAADYFARLLAWYTQGGFIDECGREWKSGHHYKIDYWEVLNEPEFEHRWSPEAYTKFYDIVSVAMRKVNPNLKFVTLGLGAPGRDEKWVEYFLNPANHSKDAPLPDFISYHFYALSQSLDETVDDWQTSFFAQADEFLKTVRSIEARRK